MGPLSSKSVFWVDIDFLSIETMSFFKKKADCIPACVGNERFENKVGAVPPLCPQGQGHVVDIHNQAVQEAGTIS